VEIDIQPHDTGGYWHTVRVADEVILVGSSEFEYRNRIGIGAFNRWKHTAAANIVRNALRWTPPES